MSIIVCALLLQGVPTVHADGSDCAAGDHCVHDDETIEDAVLVLRGDLAVLGSAKLTIRDSIVIFRDPDTATDLHIHVDPAASLVLQDVEIRVEETTLSGTIHGESHWTDVQLDAMARMTVPGTWNAQGGAWSIGQIETGADSTLEWSGISLDTNGGDILLGNNATIAGSDLELRPLHDPDDPAKGRAGAESGRLQLAGDGSTDVQGTHLRGNVACLEGATLHGSGLVATGRGTVLEAACGEVTLSASTLSAEGGQGVALRVDGTDTAFSLSTLHSRGKAAEVLSGDLLLVHSSLQGDAGGLSMSGGTADLRSTGIDSAAGRPVDCTAGRITSHAGHWAGAEAASGTCHLRLTATTLDPGIIWDGTAHPFRLVSVAGDRPALQLEGPGIVLGGPGSAPLGTVTWYGAAQRLDALPAVQLGSSSASLWFRDGDGDDRLDSGETLYLGTGGRVAAGMLRIQDAKVDAVRASHPDFGDKLLPVGGSLMSWDASGDGRRGPGDLLVWDEGDGTLGAGDRWLTAAMMGDPVEIAGGALAPAGAMTTSDTIDGFVVDDGDGVLGPGDAVLGLELPGRSPAPAAEARMVDVTARQAVLEGAHDLTGLRLGGAGHGLVGSSADLLLRNTAFSGTESIELKDGSHLEARDSRIDGDANLIKDSSTIVAFVDFAPRVVFGNGAPVQGAQVTAEQGGEPVATGTTGPDGVPFIVERRSLMQDASGIDEPDAIAVQATLGEVERTVLLRPGVDAAEVVMSDSKGPTGPLQLARSDGARNSRDVAVGWLEADDDASTASYRVELLPAHEEGTIIVAGEAQPFEATVLADTTQTQHHLVLPGQGVYTLRVTALDAAGNPGSTDELDLVWDTRAARLETALDADAGDGWYSGTVFLEVAARDAETALSDLRVQVDGSRVEPVGGRVAIDGDGHHTVQIDAFDLAGNVASEQIRLRIDSTPPLLPGVSADRTVIREPGTVRLSFTGGFLDALSGPDRVELHAEHDGETMMVERFLPPLPIGVDVPVASGRTTFTLVAFDRAGNEQAGPGLAVVVDDEAPRLRDGLNATLARDDVLRLVLLDDSAIASVVVYVDGQIVKQSAERRTEVTAAELGSGRHTIEVEVTDVVGNTARYQGTLDVGSGSTDKKSPLPLAPLLGALGWAASRRRRITDEEQTI